MVKLSILFLSLAVFLGYSSSQTMEQVKRYWKPATGIVLGSLFVYKIYSAYKKTNDVDLDALQSAIQQGKEAAQLVQEAKKKEPKIKVTPFIDTQEVEEMMENFEKFAQIQAQAKE
jgi:hypothetical protein